jgi:hypothetical protein
MIVKLYYSLKKILPRWLQIAIRRNLALAKRVIYKSRWPIDAAAGEKPPLFAGWPGGKRFALVLRHDVETGEGISNCEEILSIERAFGMRSAFYFVPEDYSVGKPLRERIIEAGCEVGVHGLKHDGRLYASRRLFMSQAQKINGYLKQWSAVGFASPSAHHVFDWIHALDILYDSSSFDTDPFEPQPDGIRTVFPVCIRERGGTRRFIEIPYTLPQDFTLFVILRKNNIQIWKRKLDWIAKRGGMAMFITHPDYMQVPGKEAKEFTYPSRYYRELLEYIENRYGGTYWHALPREIAEFWSGISGG